MTANTNQVEAIKSMIEQTTLLDKVQKLMWLDQVLPKANADQLAKMEAIFKQESEAFEDRIKETKNKTDIVKQAIKHIQNSNRESKEAAISASEKSDIASLEVELQNL